MKKKRCVLLFLTSAAELPEGQLHEVERPTHQHQHADVGDQEGAAPILVSRKGKPPNIAKTWQKIRFICLVCTFLAMNKHNIRLIGCWLWDKCNPIISPTDMEMQDIRNSMGSSHCCLSGSASASSFRPVSLTKLFSLNSLTVVWKSSGCKNELWKQWAVWQVIIEEDEKCF